jgi:hypothetical protein
MTTKVTFSPGLSVVGKAVTDALRGGDGSTWNRSFGEVGEVPTAFVTVMSRLLPATQLGRVAVIEVSETTVKVAFAPQKSTEVVPLKDVPPIMMDELDGPWTGAIDETYGVD